MIPYTVVVIVLLNKGRIMLKERRLKKKNLLAEKQEGFNSISTISEKKLSLKAQIYKNLSMQDYSHSSVFVSVLTLAADDISENNWYSGPYQMWDGASCMMESLFCGYHSSRIEYLLKKGRKMNDRVVVNHLQALIACSISMTSQGVRVLLPPLSNRLNGICLILVSLSKGFSFRAFLLDRALANQLPLPVRVADFPLRALIAGSFIPGNRIAVSSLPAIYSSPKFVPMLLMKTGIVKIVPFMLKPVPSLIAKPFAIYCNTELFKTSIPLIAPIVQKKLLKF